MRTVKGMNTPYPQKTSSRRKTKTERYDRNSHLSGEKVTVPDEVVWFCGGIDDSLWGAFHTPGCVESDGFPPVIFLEDGAVGRWLGAASGLIP